MNLLVQGGSDVWVRVFDRRNGTELECHKGHHGPVSHVMYVTSLFFRCVNPLASLQHPTCSRAQVRCLRYSPDGEAYATGSEDGSIRIWRDQGKRD